MKVQTLVSALLLPVLIITALSVNAQQQKISGNGSLKKDVRGIKESAEEISVSGTYTVYITQGSKAALEVEAEENLLPYIETVSDGDELHIQIRKGYSIQSTQPVVIRITTPKLREINSSGKSSFLGTGLIKGESLELSLSGKSSVDMNIQYTKLEVAISGDGNVKLKGSTSKTEFAISGDGIIAASEMQSGNVEVAISGKGTAHVFASKKLEVSISGKGVVKYRGNPVDVEQSVSGKGTVEKE